MKGFLRKVMLIASLGATLTFFGCQKDYTQDINKVREDLTAQLEQLESDLTGAINSVIPSRKRPSSMLMRQSRQQRTMLMQLQMLKQLKLLQQLRNMLITLQPRLLPM